MDLEDEPTRTPPPVLKLLPVKKEGLMRTMVGLQVPIFNFILILMVTVCLWEKCVDPFRVEGSFRVLSCRSAAALSCL